MNNMSSAVEGNDYDIEASVSSINSDNENVDNSLIKIILSEMKSEFNRGTGGNTEDVDENEEMSQAVDEDVDINKGPKEDVAVEHASEVDDAEEDNESEQREDECVNEPIVINNAIFDAEEDGSKQKPRLILTLRKTEESREVGGRLSRRSLMSHNSSDRSLSDVSDSSFVEKGEVDEKGSKWESRSRRSLRSSSRFTERENENTGMKRSSRRFTKEQCRESVLQNAIARKEKSFSSLNISDERMTRRGARSPRQSPSDQRRHFTRSKSDQGELFDMNTLLSIKTETDFIPKSEHSDDSNDTVNLNSTSTNSQTSEPPVDVKPLKTDKIYTKTGKRRTKYYKGLKYSLTTGGSVVRKKTLNIARRGRKKLSENSVNSQSGCSLETNVKLEPNTTECDNSDLENEDKSTYANEESKVDLSENQAEDTQTEINVVSKLKEDEEESRSESPAVGQAASCKRKFETDNEGSDESEKRCRSDVPSPLQGDAEAEPDKPEATAISIGLGTAGLCQCNSRVPIYAKTASCRSELYCQAVDSLDGRLIGCCNTVNKDEARLSRPSKRVPFLVLCDVHYHRLQRHNCCPGCGIFCTQGQFMECWAYHNYHRDCQLLDGDKVACPHCGSEDTYENNITLGAHKYPVLMPLQKPPKKMPSARMSFPSNKTDDGEEVEPDPDSHPPVVPPSCLTLPSGLQVTAQGLPQPLDKDKLEHLLHVACTIDPLSLPRYTVRNMYQAAKQGDTEKMVHMLAAGLNPNHVFREWGMGSALHAACNGGHLGVVHLLLQAGANTDVLDRDQNTPLMLACENNHNDVVKYLVKAGASVTFKGGDGMTALHLAAKSGNVEACHYLISNPNTPHNYIDSVDDGRWTPLVWAAEHKHSAVVKFLLEKRADPLVRDAEQNIALHWAALSGSIDIAEALLNYGSDVNSTNAHADTPLHIAARQNAYECVILLLARGARVDMHNRAGFVPLDCVTGAPNDTYTAIKLNVELRNLALNVQKRAHKILTNDITKGYEANPVQCVNSVDDEPEPQDFVYVTENCFTSNITVDRTITSLQSCKCREMCLSGGCMCGKISTRCWYDDEGKLLPEFNFADPPMVFECNQACACNKLMCKNRVVQHGVRARFQLYRTKGNKGWGVRTLRLIPKGSFVCEYIGEIISDCEAETREDDTYLFDLDNRDGEPYCIDARRYGNIARFINHSCLPNLMPVRVFTDHQDLHFPRIAFFAKVDIQANEELGFDYGERFWTIKSERFTCTCGAENCKYSETTIHKTLALYNRRLKSEEN